MLRHTRPRALVYLPVESKKPRKRHAKDHRRYMRDHARRRRRMSASARLAEQLKILVPRLYAIGSPSLGGNCDHHELVNDVRKKTHAAADLVLDALKLLDPSAGENFIAGAGLVATPVRRQVLATLKEADNPKSNLEITIELGEWSRSTVRRVLLELEQAGLVARSKRARLGKSTVTVWACA